MPKSRLGTFLSGVFFIGVGFLMYANKGWHFTRFGPTHHTAGYLFLVLGMILSLYALLRRDFPKKNTDNYMCISCLTPSHGNDLKEGKCPKCNGIVEDLVGFYDRHPDLKNKGTT